MLKYKDRVIPTGVDSNPEVFDKVAKLFLGNILDINSCDPITRKAYVYGYIFKIVNDITIVNEENVEFSLISSVATNMLIALNEYILIDIDTYSRIATDVLKDKVSIIKQEVGIYDKLFTFIDKPYHSFINENNKNFFKAYNAI